MRSRPAHISLTDASTTADALSPPNEKARTPRAPSAYHSTDTYSISVVRLVAVAADAGDDRLLRALVQPLMNTVYRVKVKNTTSPTVTAKVRPRLRLRKPAAHRYSLRVFAAQSFAGKYATFQRYNGTLGRWIKVKRVLLRANATGVAPTVISSVSFRSGIRPRLKVRVVLPQLQVGSCYRPGRSNVIRS